MRCNKHYTDLSSSIGVCACCLRERLLSLITAQQQIHSHIQNLHNSDNIIQPFPNRLKSVSPRHHHHHHILSNQLFHKTPSTADNSKQKRSFIRLLSFPNFFRSTNRKPVDSVSKPNASSDSTFGDNDNFTSSWFSRIIAGGFRRRRRKKKKTVCTDESTVTAAAGTGLLMRNRDDVIVVGGDEDELRKETSSGYESLKNTPRRTPVVRRGGSGGHVRNNNNISGLTFCLSPLVRASPNKFCANKSRKLADFGRVNPNR